MRTRYLDRLLTRPDSVPQRAGGASAGWRGTRPAQRETRASSCSIRDTPVFERIIELVDERARWLVDLPAANA
jgi:hypothetical protein